MNTTYLPEALTAMSEGRPKYLHVYKDRLGKERCYLRHKGRRTALTAEIGTPEFQRQYDAALAAAVDGSDLTGPVVYFVRCGDRMKIGTTSHPVKNRIATMQVGSAHKLHLIVAVPGGRELERGYHARFASARLDGEWFSATDELRSFVASLRTYARRIRG